MAIVQHGTQTFVVPDDTVDTFKKSESVQKGEPAVDVPDYQSMTVAELRSTADDLGVDLTGLSRKADIVTALQDTHAR